MKRLPGLPCAALMFALFATTADAQLPDGTVAPDFTVYDLNGNKHHLYGYLDQGKFVVLDFMSADCSPCWGYHVTGELERFYELHGPHGTNDAVVLMIDAWSTSRREHLEGKTQPTYGDWLTGTPYPVVDLSEISSVIQSYQALTVPRFYRICPSTRKAYHIHPTGGNGAAPGATVAGLEAFMLEQCAMAASVGHDETDDAVVTATADRIMVTLPDGAPCRITLHDIVGAPVRELTTEAGQTTINLDISDVPSSLYLLRVAFHDGRSILRRIPVVR